MNTEEKVREGRRVTYIGMLVNLALIAFKFMAGIVGQSQGMIADAFHSFSDFVTDIVVLVGLKIGGKAPDETHPYGHARMETMASTLVGLAILAVAVGVGADAGISLYNQQYKSPGFLALVAAAVSIGAKEALFWYTIIVGRRIKSLAVQANAWHHRSDAFSSVAVLVGVGAALIWPQLHFLDSLAALTVSFLLLKVGIDIIWPTLKEFVDSAPGPDKLEEIKNCILTVAGVQGFHDIRVRTSGGLYQMEVHVVVDGNLTVGQGHHIAKEVEICLLREVEDMAKVTVHVDPREPET